jgi:hypothetical protein
VLYNFITFTSGDVVASLVQELWYKPEFFRFETHQNHSILSFYLILPVTVGPEVYSVCNRNEYQKKSKENPLSRAQLVLKADDITTICEPTV